MYKNNKEKPFISVVLPTYNHAHFLKDAIDSVIKHAHGAAWELANREERIKRKIQCF